MEENKPGLDPLVPAQEEDSGLPCCSGGCRCGSGRRLSQPEPNGDLTFPFYEEYHSVVSF